MEITHINAARFYNLVIVGHCLLVHVLRWLSTKHADSTTKDVPNKALAEVILKNPGVYKKVEPLTWDSVKSKISRTEVLIKDLDVTTLCRILLTDALNLLHTLKCCKKCNHKCTCGGSQCEGLMNCTKTQCQAKCHEKMKNKSSGQVNLFHCKFIVFKKFVVLIRQMRNALSHKTKLDYENHDAKKITFNDFPKANTWDELWIAINDIMSSCVEYLLLEKKINAEEKEDILLDIKLAHRKTDFSAQFCLFSISRGNVDIENKLGFQGNMESGLKELKEQISTNQKLYETIITKLIGTITLEGIDVCKKEIIEFDDVKKFILWIDNGLIFELSRMPNMRDSKLLSIEKREFVKQTPLQFVKVENVIYKNGNLTIQGLQRGHYDLRFDILADDLDQNQTYRFNVKNVEIIDHLPHKTNNPSKQTICFCHPYGRNSDIQKVLREENENDTIEQRDNVRYNKGARQYNGNLINASRYLTDNYQEETFICFPPIESRKKDSVLVEKLTKFYKCKQKKEVQSVRCVVFTQYQTKYHLEAIGENEENCNIELPVDESNKTRLLVVDEDCQAIFNIRISCACNVTDTNDDLRDGQEDLKALYFLNKEFFRKNKNLKCCLLSLVCTEKLTSEELKNKPCNECLFLSKDELEADQDDFNKFWEKNIRKAAFNELGTDMLLPPESRRDIFLQLCNDIMVIMSLTKLQLPKAFGGDGEKIENLILNKKQRKAVYEKHLKKIVTGPYGSGKSVVLQKAFKNLYEDEACDGLIYVITWEEHSLMHAEMNGICKEIEKSEKKIYCKNIYELSVESKSKVMLSLPECLEYLAEKHKESKVHIFVEEFDPETVKEKDVVLLESLLKENTAFKDSMFMLTLQSLKRERKTVIEGLNFFWRRKELNSLDHKSYNVNDLAFRINARVYNLEKVMRYTKAVHFLIKEVQDIVSSNSNKYYIDLTSANEQTNVKTIPKDQNDAKPGPSEDNAVSGDSASTDSLMSDSTDGIKDDEKPKSTVKIDRVGRIYNNKSKRDKGEACVKTSFTFFKNDGCGHEIDGNWKPQLIRLPRSFLKEDLEKLSAILWKLLSADKQRALFICNDYDMVIEVYNALIISGNRPLYNLSSTCEESPSVDDMHKVYNEWSESTNTVLLTDNRGVCGLQHENVYVFMDEDNEMDNYLLPEAISRTTDKITLISFRTIQNEHSRKKSQLDISVKLIEEKVVQEKTLQDFEGCLQSFKRPKKINSMDFPKSELQLRDEQEVLNQLKTNLALRRSSWMPYDYQVLKPNFGEFKYLLKYGHSKTFNEYISIDPKNAKSSDNNTNLLHVAAEFDASTCIESLLYHGCDLMKKDRMGRIPLHIAAEKNSVKSAEILMKVEPDSINVTDGVFDTPLHKAVKGDEKAELVKMLLTNPMVNIQIKNAQNCTPLTWATPNIKQILIEFQAKRNIKTCDSSLYSLYSQ